MVQSIVYVAVDLFSGAKDDGNHDVLDDAPRGSSGRLRCGVSARSTSASAAALAMSRSFRALRAFVVLHRHFHNHLPACFTSSQQTMAPTTAKAVKTSSSSKSATLTEAVLAVGSSARAFGRPSKALRSRQLRQNKSFRLWCEILKPPHLQ